MSRISKGVLAPRLLELAGGNVPESPLAFAALQLVTPSTKQIEQQLVFRRLFPPLPQDDTPLTPIPKGYHLLNKG